MKRVINAIAEQQDVFLAAHDTQRTLITSLHEDTITHVEDSHREILEEIRVRLLYRVSSAMSDLFLATTAACC